MNRKDTITPAEEHRIKRQFAEMSPQQKSDFLLKQLRQNQMLIHQILGINSTTIILPVSVTATINQDKPAKSR